jgi:branched-chain amino acid transport system permease protein
VTEYILYVAGLAAIYAVLALSLDVLVGQLGLMSLAQAAFFGIGAYATAAMVNSLGANMVTALAVSVFAGVACSLFVSIPALRLRGDYFVIAAFAFQLVTFSIFNNFVELTGGPLGMSVNSQGTGIGNPTVSHLVFLATAATTIMAGIAILWTVRASRFGRLFRAIRDDEILANSLGKNTALVKTCALALSAAIAAAMGSIYALYLQFIDPSSFSVFESVLILAMVLLWKPATAWGPIAGAVSLIALTELLRFTSITTAESANLRQIVFGVVLIVVVFVRGRLIFRAGAGTAG